MASSKGSSVFSAFLNISVEDRIFHKCCGHMGSRGANVGSRPRNRAQRFGPADGPAAELEGALSLTPQAFPFRGEVHLLCSVRLKLRLLHTVKVLGQRRDWGNRPEELGDSLVSGWPTLAPAWTELPRDQILCLLSPQTAAQGDQDGDDEEDGDEDFVEVPEKEGYEACVPAHLWPEDGERRCGGAAGRRPLLSTRCPGSAVFLSWAGRPESGVL